MDVSSYPFCVNHGMTFLYCKATDKTIQTIWQKEDLSFFVVEEVWNADGKLVHFKVSGNERVCARENRDGSYTWHKQFGSSSWERCNSTEYDTLSREARDVNKRYCVRLTRDTVQSVDYNDVLNGEPFFTYTEWSRDGELRERGLIRADTKEKIAFKSFEGPRMREYEYDYDINRNMISLESKALVYEGEFVYSAREGYPRKRSNGLSSQRSGLTSVSDEREKVRSTKRSLSVDIPVPNQRDDASMGGAIQKTVSEGTAIQKTVSEGTAIQKTMSDGASIQKTMSEGTSSNNTLRVTPSNGASQDISIQQSLSVDSRSRRSPSVCRSPPPRNSPVGSPKNRGANGIVLPPIPVIESSGSTAVSTQERAMNNPAVKWFTAGCFDDLNIMKDFTALLFRGCNGSYYNKSFSTFTALERVTVASSSLNGLERASFDSMANLVSIDVGDNSCSALSSLQIKECGRLTSVKVGSHCFDGKPGRVIRELRIESCDALEFVTIGDSSFSQWEKITLSGSLSVFC